LPIAITISNLIHHFIGIGILLGVMTVFYSVHISVLWIFLYMPILVLLAQGLGWIVAGLHVFLRDTIQALQIIMMLWFWFTPILYTLDRLPPKLRLLETLNPMAVIVTGYRTSLLHQGQPGAIQVAVVLAVSVIVFIVGALFFRQAKPAFPEVL
jgi:ABC-type polysaccharide/polyol phosphate export permease